LLDGDAPLKLKAASNRSVDDRCIVITENGGQSYRSVTRRSQGWPRTSAFVVDLLAAASCA
jgi:hypothetical protein